MQINQFLGKLSTLNNKKMIKKMKVVFYILFITTIQISANVYSQNATVSIHLKNAGIIDVFNEIEKQSEYKIFYKTDNIDKRIQVSVNEESITVNSLLKNVLSEHQLSFDLVDKVIVITPNVISQDLPITGRVTDESGEPIPGVNIVVKGTTAGTVSDLNGKFSIQVKPGAILVVSFIGYTSQEFETEGVSNLDIVLKENTLELDEVVVTALGMKREQKSLGYSVSTVKSEDLNQGASVNMLKSLQGKTTGVNIVSLSSDPTSSTFVTVRGATSISAWKDKKLSNKSQPLYVLDGIPIGEGAINDDNKIDIGNFMSRLNPNDIESITILKGASAGALYGARAGNGVVMITTKSGAGAQKGIGVSVSSAITADVVRATIPVQNEFLTGDRYDSFGMEGGNGWGTQAGSQYANQNWKQWDIVKQQFYEGPVLNYTTEDRIKAFMETGWTNTNDVTVTGNYDKGNYRISFQNLTNSGVIPNNHTHRNSLSFNGMYKILNNLSVSSSASYTRTYTPNKSQYSGNDTRMGIVQTLYSIRPEHPAMSVWKSASRWIDGYEGRMQNTPFIRDKGTLNVREQYPLDEVRGSNPYYIAEEMIYTFATDNLFGKVELDWKAFSPLTFKLRTGVEKNTLAFERRLAWDSRDRPKGQFSSRNTSSTNVNTDLLAIYNQRFGDFDINAIGGFSYAFGQSNMTFLDTDNSGLSRPNDFSIGAIAGGLGALKNEYKWDTSRSQSLYATASFGWKSMLYLDASVRNDWYNITERTKASNLYPSVALSWLASETFTLPDWWTLAKLRGGIAVVGYGVQSYVNANTYGFGPSYGDITTGTVTPVLIDPNLKPEANTTVEGGFTLGFIDNRINFDFTYFQKVHSNQIGDVPIVASTGFSTMKTNIGEVTSKGIEMALNLGIIRSSDWTWNVGANYSSAKAEITKLNDSFTSVEVNFDGNTRQIIRKGETVGGLYAQKDFYTVQTGKFAGQHIIDYTGMNQGTDTKDRRPYLGNLNPDFIMGFTTDLRYKRLTLNVVATMRVGGVYCSQTWKVLQNDGLTFDTYTGDGVYYVGGRVGYGGLAWPNPDNIEIDALKTYISNSRKDFNDASYIRGVFVDPRSGKESNDETLGNGTFTYQGQELPYYIEQGADPNATFYTDASGPIGDTWDYAQTRTFSATNFKIREITLSYDIPSSFTQKFRIQNAQIAFIAKNVFHWNKSGINEDPETAFTGSVGENQGIAAFTLPYIASFGAKLTLNF